MFIEAADFCELKPTSLSLKAMVFLQVLVTGLESTGSVPAGALVTVHYCFFLEFQDDPFDSTRLRGRPSKFRLDAGSVVEGLEIAVKSMKKKEKAEFLFSPDYAYGSLGCYPR